MSRNRRGRRDKPERRPKPPVSTAYAEPAAAPSDALVDVDPLEHVDLVEPIEADLEEGATAEPLPEEELVEAIEQLTHPEAEEKIEPPSMPVAEAIGAEQLTRLRARFAELQARITERGGDLERIEALRAQAEPLNPDSWVTDDEVRRGSKSSSPGFATCARRLDCGVAGGRAVEGAAATAGEREARLRPKRRLSRLIEAPSSCHQSLAPTGSRGYTGGHHENSTFCALAGCGFSGDAPGFWRRASRATTPGPNARP